MESDNHKKRQRSRGRRAGNKKCLTDETGVIERALRSLCQNDGKLSLENLEKKVGQFDPGLGSLEEIISDFHDVHFRIIDRADGSVIVEAHTQAKICPSYLKKECEEGDACQNLHLCGYYATGSCCWFGVKCRKSHDFRSDHNKQVLKKFDIAFLRHECLQILFRLAWPHFTVPEFCRSYRSQHGCTYNSCWCLHICKNFVMKECTYGPRCKFAHDVYAEASNLRLLKRFNLEYCSDGLIRLIKERNEGYYRPDLEVLESDGEDSDGEESDEESCSSDTSETMPKSQTQSNDLLNFSNPKTMARQDKKKEVYKNNPLITTKHEPQATVQTTSPSKRHVVMAQNPVKSQTQSNDLLALDFSQTVTLQDKNTEVCNDNPHVTTKHEPEAIVQTTSPSECYLEMSPHATSQTQSNDLLDLVFSQTMTRQEKTYEVSKGISNITAKHEPNVTVQTTSTFEHHVVMPQPPAKCQTTSKHFSNPQGTGKMQDKTVDKPLFPTNLEPTHTKQKPSASEYFEGTSLLAESQIQSKRFVDSNNSQTVALQSKKEEVCKDNLRGSCPSGSLCQRHHCDLPYQWQVQNNEIWESVDSFRNSAMEKEYCDMNGNVPACLDFDTWGCMLIFYDGMYISSPEFSLIRPIRRLEVKGEPELFDYYLIPYWSWCWKDECGTWIEYSEQNTKQNARSDKESSDFETLYNDYRSRGGSQTVKFKAGNHHYTLNFGTMIQTNDQYHTQKDVRRRPSRHITLADVKRYREEKPWQNKNKYPRTWNMNLRGKSHLLVEVTKHEDREEYKKIQKLFQTTLLGVNITKLERVQNETCWDLFSRQKEVMMKKNPSKPVQERLLFHGTTPEKVEDICRDNFDFRLSGTRVGAAYGQGAYFASTSKYSDFYADEAEGYNVKKIFVARVLVGSYTTGTRDMRRPPFKNPSDKTKGMYDSCVDNTSNPSIFVVFDNHQVYPEYLITYSTSSANHTSYRISSQPSSYNLYTAAMRSTSSASQITRTSTSQRNSYNPSTRTTARSVYSSNQTSYTGTSQRNSYIPSTSTNAGSVHRANQISYNSTNTPSRTARSTANQTSNSSSTSSSRNTKSSCVCM